MSVKRNVTVPMGRSDLTRHDHPPERIPGLPRPPNRWATRQNRTRATFPPTRSWLILPAIERWMRSAPTLMTIKPRNFFDFAVTGMSNTQSARPPTKALFDGRKRASNGSGGNRTPATFQSDLVELPYAKRRCSECVRGRLPLAKALRDELSPLLFAPTVQHLQVRRVSPKVDAGGPGIQGRIAI
jgi:hypothetical protein